MLRVMRFQLRVLLPGILAILSVLGLGSLLGIAVTGRADGLFFTYYQMYPAMAIFTLFIIGTSSTSAYIGLCLSMGVTRRTYFAAIQWSMVLFSLLAAAIGALAAVIPGWTGMDWLQPPLTMAGLPVLVLATLFFQEAAGVLGFLGGKNRWLMVLVTVLSVLLLGLVTFLVVIAGEDGTPWLGGSLWMLGGGALGSLVLAAIFRLLLAGYVVK